MTDNEQDSTIQKGVIAELTAWQDNEFYSKASRVARSYCERLPSNIGGPRMEFDPESEDGKFLIEICGQLLQQIEEIRDGKQVDKYPKVSIGRYYCSFIECINPGEVPCPECCEWSCRGHFNYKRGLCLPCQEKEDKS